MTLCEEVWMAAIWMFLGAVVFSAGFFVGRRP